MKTGQVLLRIAVLVTDYGWTPNMFTDKTLTTLTDFGKQVKAWQSAKATSDWVQ